MSGTPDSCMEETDQASRSTLVGTFLNFESPTQRRGTVSSWKYCYYKASGHYQNNDMFKAQIMVYRQNPYRSNQYEQVPESVSDIIIVWDNIPYFDNCCWKTKHFEILENDIIGACTDHHGSGNPLQLMEANENSNLSTYQFSQGSYERCNQTQFSTDISSGSLIRQPTIFLNVYPVLSGKH